MGVIQPAGCCLSSGAVPDVCVLGCACTVVVACAADVYAYPQPCSCLAAALSAASSLPECVCLCWGAACLCAGCGSGEVIHDLLTTYQPALTAVGPPLAAIAGISKAAGAACVRLAPFTTGADTAGAPQGGSGDVGCGRGDEQGGASREAMDVDKSGVLGQTSNRGGQNALFLRVVWGRARFADERVC